MQTHTEQLDLFQQAKKGGRPPTPIHPDPVFASYGFTVTILERFYKHVRITDCCWIWDGAVNTNGYGTIGRGKKRDGLIGAHILSWIIHFGPVPEGKWILHDCPIGDNPLCVNPAHLWSGTHTDNMHDMMRKLRARFRGVAYGEKLTWEKVDTIRVCYPTLNTRELAEAFNVTDTAICDVVNFETWKLHTRPRETYSQNYQSGS